MKLTSLIWSSVTVWDFEKSKGHRERPDDALIEKFSHGSVVIRENQLRIREHRSAQGISLDYTLHYSYPELISMGPDHMTLKAWTWGKTAKDSPVLIELTF